MTDYKSPRPSATTSAANPDALYDNAVTFEKLLNEYANQTTYKGKELISWLKALDLFGFGVAPFDFATGGTLENKNLLIRHSDELLYRYVGAGAFPLIVSPATNPVGNPDWEAFTATSLQALSGLTEPSDLAQRHRTKTTTTEIATGVFKDGDRLEVVELGDDPFDVVTGGTPNGYDILDAGPGKTAVLKKPKLVDPRSFGLLLDGSDETAKWQALVAYCATNRLGVGPFSGSTLITSQLLLPAGFGGIYGASQLYMVFIKGFNGDLFSANSQGCQLNNFWIQGDGFNFTGGGIYVVSDNVKIDHVRITDTADSGVICKSNDATFLQVDNCHITPTSTATAAIRGDGVDASNAPTVRRFSRISGAFTIDVSGMNEVGIEDTLFSDLITSADTGKLVMRGCRITAAANNINILGVDHVIDGNNWTHGNGFATTISGSNIMWGDNNYAVGTNTKASPLIASAYGSAMANRINSNLIDFSASVEWKGSTSDGAFGNSTKSAYFSLKGDLCYFTFNMIRGSTATLPVGTWSITVPFKAWVGARFPVLIKSSSGTFYSATGQIQGGGNQIIFYLDATTGPVTEASIAFGTNAQLEVSGVYMMSPT